MNSNSTLQVTDREVTFQNFKDGITLSGTLSVPKTEDKPAIVVMIAGMGPNDREYEIMGRKLWQELTVALLNQGIAVLRYDKRGTGKSGGIFDMISTSADFTEDVLSAVKFLKQNNEIDPNRIGLIGHSEGGLISFMAASKSDDIAFIVSLCGALSNDIVTHLQMQLKADGATDQFLISDKIMRMKMLEIIKTQSEDDAQITLSKLFKSYVDGMSDEQKVEAVHLLFAVKQNNYLQMVATFNSAWYRFYLKHDSLEFISKVKVPVLAINGELDFIIAAKTALPKIEQGLKMANNQNVTIKAIENQNHWFQSCTVGSLSEMGTIKETMNESTIKLIVDWTLKTTQFLVS